MYFVIDNATKEAVLVDPSDATTVQTFLKENPEINLKAILATHHHWDHVGGIPAVLEGLATSIPVYRERKFKI